METAEQTTARELAAYAVLEEHALQKPEELAELAELLVERLPAAPRVLEIGLGEGGTAWLWRALWPEAVIVGLDVRQAICAPCQFGQAHNGCPRRRVRAAVTRLILADSIRDREAVLDTLAEGTGTIDFLHIDGDHSFEGLRSDFDTYSRLVRPGGLIAIHDHLGYPDVARYVEWLEEAHARAGWPSLRVEAEPRTWGGYLVLEVPA